MGLVAAFDVGCEALPLTSVARAVPDATLVLELQFTHGPRPLFLLTATSAPPDALEPALTDAADVDDWTLVGTAGETRRYQATPALSFAEQLGDEIDDLAGLEALAQTDTIVERIEVQPGGWRQTGWFATREAFESFASFWRDQASFRLRRLTRDGEPEPPGDGLTDRQREALRAAHEMGHFEVPRGASLEEVAAELDISASALSERLRRAQTRLVRETVAPTWPPLPDDR